MFGADWAFGIVGALETIVRSTFPGQLRQWPLLQAFNWEVYTVGDDHFVIILRDKLSGIPAGPGQPQPLPHTDFPPLPTTMRNIDRWLTYLTRKFGLQNEDITMVLPIHDSGQHGAAADFDLFTPEERQVWDHQLRYAILRQKTGMQTQGQVAPHAPTNITYNVYGNQARVNIQSTDASTNIESGVTPELFQQLITAIRKHVTDESVKTKMERAAEEMKDTYGSRDFVKSYTSFMSILADHIQVFGPIVAPYLPGLAKLLT
jgi:hypothetical protein